MIYQVYSSQFLQEEVKTNHYDGDLLRFLNLNKASFLLKYYSMLFILSYLNLTCHIKFNDF